jgi:hypothetical protein
MGGSVRLTFLPSFDAAKALAQSLQDALDGFTYESGIAEGKRLAIEALERFVLSQSYTGCYWIRRCVQEIDAIVSNEYVKEGE